MKLLSKYVFVTIAFFVLIFSLQANADCVNPVGVEGEQVFNKTYKVMQFCNGIDWLSMDASSIEGGLDNLGDHIATQNIDANSNQLINLSLPIANTDAATKEYVDTVAAASGGGGAAYIAWGTTSCTSGWDTAYTGYGIVMGSKGGSYESASSDMICVSSAAGINFSGQITYVVGYLIRGDNRSTNANVVCAVCVK